MTRTSGLGHVTSLLRNLQWLLIKGRISCKSLGQTLMTFRSWGPRPTPFPHFLSLTVRTPDLLPESRKTQWISRGSFGGAEPLTRRYRESDIVRELTQSNYRMQRLPTRLTHSCGLGQARSEASRQAMGNTVAKSWGQQGTLDPRRTNWSPHWSLIVSEPPASFIRLTCRRSWSL